MGTEALTYPYRGVVRRKGVFHFTHRMLIGASGAITGQDATSGLTATKQGTAGQYLIQAPRGYKKVTSKVVDFIGNTGSVVADWSGDNITIDTVPGGSAGTPSLGQITLQLRLAGTATDVASGAILTIRLEVENGV